MKSSIVLGRTSSSGTLGNLWSFSHGHIIAAYPSDEVKTWFACTIFVIPWLQNQHFASKWRDRSKIVCIGNLKPQTDSSPCIAYVFGKGNLSPAGQKHRNGFALLLFALGNFNEKSVHYIEALAGAHIGLKDKPNTGDFGAQTQAPIPSAFWCGK